MALQSRVLEHVCAECLEEPWVRVGSGGFSCVYKARHKKWKFDVAIKLPHDNAGSVSIFQQDNEAKIMDLVSCEHVLRVYGVFEGCPPIRGKTEQKGIVMEFMPRGSIESLQKALGGPPPLPLAFRLVHEVALGMNFLHSKNLMHSDLKPSNVLLNADLHAKLADFGLSMVSNSALNSRESAKLAGGTFKYMPPEAFQLSYKPVRSFDVYSYGILLWSVLTGKEPYDSPAAAEYSVVALRISLGDRPLLEELDPSTSERSRDLVDLMTKCWNEIPETRPSFEDCIDVTQGVISKHGSEVLNAVSEVLRKLDPSGVSPVRDNPSPAEEEPSSYDSVDCFRISPPENQQQNQVGGISDTEKAKFVDDNRSQLIQRVSEVMAIVDKLGDKVHKETYSLIRSKPTREEKMRELFQSTLRSGGEMIKAAFYDVLVQDEPYLMRSLGVKA